LNTTPINSAFLYSCAVIVGTALLLPLNVQADASDGEFLGYSLGTAYENGGQPAEVTASGNTIFVAADPSKPADINKVTLLTTPKSQSIGFISGSTSFATEAEARKMGKHYFELLRAKYSEWRVGREIMNKDFQIVEVSLVDEPHELRLQLTQDETSNQWSFSMTLGWTHGSKEAQAWRNMATTQNQAAQVDGRQQFLENADTTGL